MKKEEFDLYTYATYLEYIDRRKKLKWFQFKAKYLLNKWLKSKLNN